MNIEKDIENLNEIIDSGWLISDLEKCTAIDACEDAITALKQYPVLDKIRAEIELLSNANPSYWHSGDMVEREEVLDIIEKYRKESEEA